MASTDAALSPRRPSNTDGMCLHCSQGDHRCAAVSGLAWFGSMVSPAFCVLKGAQLCALQLVLVKTAHFWARSTTC